jgi:hypothetical protein
MRLMKLMIVAVSTLLIGNMACAETLPAVEFFYSNNKGEISVQAAYQRLQGDPQHLLKSDVVKMMRLNQIDKGTSEDILGAYFMSTDKKMTADNTEIFSVLPTQKLSKERIFTIAKKIAEALSQESVAVFIPTQEKMIGDMRVVFTQDKPKINDVIKMIHEKLPASYSQAFSLHLVNEVDDYVHARIKAVEWLGGKAKWNELKAAFPHDKISYQYGKSYLIYKNGNVAPL